MIKRALLLCCCGALSAFAWAPWSYWPLALAAYAVLFYCLLSTERPWHALALGLAFGLGLHAIGHLWIYPAMRYAVNNHPVWGAVFTGFYLTYLAAFTALACYVFRLLRRTISRTSVQASDIALFALLMAAGTWLRGILFNGFTSLSLGYGLTDTWLEAFAPVLGLYGLSAVGYGLSALGMGLLMQRKKTYALAILTITGLAWAMQFIDWTQPQGSPLRYALFQPDFKRSVEDDPAAKVQARTQALIQRMVSLPPTDLIASPETAFPLPLSQFPTQSLVDLQNFSTRTNSHFFLGLSPSKLSPAADNYNSTVHFAPNENISQYNKVRLMPIGEYLPYIAKWLDYFLVSELTTLTPGAPDQPPFHIGKIGIGTLICHEEITPEASRAWAPQVGILLNPSNLEWFDYLPWLDSHLAHEQSLQMVRIRALETGRPLLRVTNTGVTAHIDPHGKILQRLPLPQAGVLSGTVQATTGSTPYVRWGDTLFFCALGIVIAHALWRCRRERKAAA